MRTTLSFCLLLTVLPIARAQDTHPFGPGKDLKVCYAGPPGDTREHRFVEFLRSHFPKVDTLDLEKLSQDAVKGYDVVVADWKRVYADGKDQLEQPKVMLTPEYTKSTILIGAVAGSITRKSGTKLDWL